jgi:phospholipase/carboxylesterase
MMSQTSLNTVEIEPRVPARHAVIWLHGLGADGHDFEPIVPELKLPEVLAVLFVFPHAPVRPVTMNGGLPMRAWFDLAGLDLSAPVDRVGLDAARVAVEGLIRRENERGIPTERIVLAGFSQGGAVALYAGLSYSERLAGIMGLSTFLADDFEIHAANRKTPVFMAHGLADNVVAFRFGEHTRDRLGARGQPVQWHGYPMAHAVCPAEIGDIRAWMLQLFRTD